MRYESANSRTSSAALDKVAGLKFLAIAELYLSTGKKIVGRR